MIATIALTTKTTAKPISVYTSQAGQAAFSAAAVVRSIATLFVILIFVTSLSFYFFP
jgi:hypothetical protein